MADADHDNRTEQPTAKRLSEAFEKGQFARAPEIGIAFGLATSFCVLLFVIPGLSLRVAETSTYVFANLARIDLNQTSVPFLFQSGLKLMFSLILPMIAVAAISAIIAEGLQSGFRVTPKVIELKFNKLNPTQGIKKVISKQVFAKLGIDLLKLAALVAIIYTAITRILDDPIFYTPVDVMHVGEFIRDSALFVLIRIAVACALVAVISYIYHWRKNRKDLMMTRQEVKDERRQAEIDPHVRSAQRALARRILQRQMIDAVPTADVVVTNPTHFAVALKYERGRDRAPVVLAKGRDLFARRIKEVAALNGVPTVENKLVARALYKYGSVGREIPAQLYQTVAEILSFVYRTHRYYFHRLKARRLGVAAT